MLADVILQSQLQTWLNSLYEPLPWYVDLFVNNYVPQGGDTPAEYTLPTWAGYAQVEMLAGTWGPVTVTDHVASSTQATQCVYLLPAGVPSQVIYGYLVTDYYGTLVYAESWTAPVTIPAGGGLTIIPVLRNGIQCVPTMHNARGAGRKRNVVVADDDDDDGEE
jgi:hypothetical protein